MRMAALIVAGAAWLGSAGAWAGDADNPLADKPLKNAKIGAWVEHKQIIESGGKKTEQVIRRELIEKEKKNVLIEESMSMNGKSLPAQERKVFFDEPYYFLPQPPNTKFEKLAEGVEKVAHKGKDHNCRWMQLKLSAGSGAFDALAKIWYSPDVPLSGVLKFEVVITAPQKGTIISELTGSGEK
jgi:hypothetical protein